MAQRTSTTSNLTTRATDASYSGPFDLLLNLVKKEIISPESLSVFDLTEQYVRQISDTDSFDLDVAGDFLYVAASLMYLKALSLSEGSFDPDEDESDYIQNEAISFEEFKKTLVERILLYHQVQGASQNLQALDEAEMRYIAGPIRNFLEFRDLKPDYLDEITLRTLSVMCADLCSRVNPPILDAPHVSKKRPAISELAKKIDLVMRAGLQLSFYDLIKDDHSAENVVGNFLAVLELHKLGIISVTQKRIFSEIKLTLTQNAPSYTEVSPAVEYDSHVGDYKQNNATGDRYE